MDSDVVVELVAGVAVGVVVAAGMSASASVEASRCICQASSCNGNDFQEYDQVPRRATVYLFCRALENKPEETRVHFQHWAIVVVFEGGCWRTAEGNRGDDCNLHAFYSKERPRKHGKYLVLGDVEELSPSQLREFVRNVSLTGGPYLLGIRNCQEWAKELASKLGKNIEDKVNNVATLREVDPFLAYPLAAGYASSNSFSRMSHSKMS